MCVDRERPSAESVAAVTDTSHAFDGPVAASDGGRCEGRGTKCCVDSKTKDQKHLVSRHGGVVAEWNSSKSAK